MNDREWLFYCDLCTSSLRDARTGAYRATAPPQTDAGLQPAVVPKLRRIVSFLQDMGGEGELRTVPSWNAHRLTGDRQGVWSLTVTRNWRITFRIDTEEAHIVDLNCGDYHQEAAMSGTGGIRMKNPAHPGGFVKSEIIEALDLTVTEAAQGCEKGSTLPACKIGDFQVIDHGVQACRIDSRLQPSRAQCCQDQIRAIGPTQNKSAVCFPVPAFEAPNL